MTSATRLRRSLALILIGLGAAAAGLAPSASLGQEAAASVSAKQEVKSGEALLSRCDGCHFASGGGPRSGDTPAIAGQHRKVLLKELSDFRYGKRWVTSMRRVTDPHTMALQDLMDVAQFASNLPWRTTQVRGDGSELARGAEVYGSRCAGCHGRPATGSDEAAVPRLAGQSYRYLLRQMYDAVDKQRANLPSNHIALLKSFKRAEFVGVADYLSRLDAEPTP
jgi:cytochrome c553